MIISDYSKALFLKPPTLLLFKYYFQPNTIVKEQSKFLGTTQLCRNFVQYPHYTLIDTIREGGFIVTVNHNSPQNYTFSFFENFK